MAYEKIQTADGQKKVVDLAQRFATTFPTDPQAPTVLLKAGELLFEEHRYHEARGVLENLLARYLKQNTSATAQKLVAHSYMQEGRYEEARKAYSQALALLPPSDTKGHQDLADLMAAAIYKAGEQHKKENRLDAAAHLFEEISQVAPETELAPVALFEAGTLYETMKKPREAIATYQNLVHRYPRSGLAGKANVQVGLLYEQEGEEFQAAYAFDAAAQSIQEPDLAPTLLWKAGLHYEKAAQWEKSYSTFLRFTKQFPQHPDVAEALFKMAHAQQEQGKIREALQLFEKVEQKSPGTSLAAEALFQTAEETFRELKAIRLKEPLAKNFKKKTKVLERVVTLYTRAAETRFSDVVTVSAHRLGEVFEHFKTSLLDSERPRNLNKEQLEEYLFQLEEKAYPFEEKAVEAYVSNVQRAQNQTGLYNEWIKKSYNRLAELRPSLYRRPERTERITSNIDVEALSAHHLKTKNTKILKAER